MILRNPQNSIGNYSGPYIYPGDRARRVREKQPPDETRVTVVLPNPFF